MNTTYIVYYTTETGPQSFETVDMSIALKFIENIRRRARNGLKITHIVLSAENPNQSGLMGVDEVKNGKTPDGEVYDWNKDSRIGKMKRSDTVIEDEDV